LLGDLKKSSVEASNVEADLGAWILIHQVPLKKFLTGSRTSYPRSSYSQTYPQVCEASLRPFLFYDNPYLKKIALID